MRQANPAVVEAVAAASRAGAANLPGAIAAGRLINVAAGLLISVAAGLLINVAAGLLITAAAEPARAAGDVPWSLIESSERGVVLAVQVPEPVWVAAEGGAGRIEVPGFDGWGLAGDRVVPVLNLRVALPPDADIAVGAEAFDPLPLGHALTELVAVDAPTGDPDPYSRADPDGFVRYGRPGWGATQRMLDLAVHPVCPDERGWLRAPRALRITITFTPPAQPAAPGGPADPAGSLRTRAPDRADGWAPLLDRLVVNPASAGEWRRAPTAARGAAKAGDGLGNATTWVRIEIERRGFYVITGDDLAGLGFEPALVDLGRLRLFCAPAGELPEGVLGELLPDWLQPCALWVVDDGDGLWDEATRVYFLGNGPDGWRDDLGLPTLAGDRYYAHPYASSFTYWLTWNGEFSTEPPWMEERAAVPAAGATLLASARARLHLEENSVYDPRPRVADLPWERFLWVDLTGVPSKVDFTLPHLVPGTAATVRLLAWGRNAVSDSYVDHNLLVEAQIGPLTSSPPRIPLGTLAWDGYERGLLDAQVTANASQMRVWASIPARVDAQGKPITDASYLAWIECEYERDLIMRGDSLEFFVTAGEAVGSAWRITELATPEGWLLLDASDARAPVRLVPRYVQEGAAHAAEFSLTPAGATARIVMLKLADAAAPARLSVPEWRASPVGAPLLRERTEAVDYVIIAPRQFAAAAQELAAYRARRFYGPAGDAPQAARVALVDVQQIFDEFSGGQRDPVALRNFVRHAWLNWKGESSGPTFSHLTLLGNAHYDPRGYLGLGATDHVPGYLYYNFSYTTDPQWRPEHFGDDWFGMLDGPTDLWLDLALGRLPVMSASEATGVVRKLIRYDENPPQGAWRSRVLLAADDICQSYNSDQLGWLHVQQTEQLADDLVPRDADIVKLYMIEYGSRCIYDRKPEAARDLLADLNDGVLWFNFTGHGSEVQLADERLLETRSLGSLANGEKLFFFLTASCAVGKFAHGGDGLGVAAVRMADGGAVGAFSASGLAGAGSNGLLNRRVVSRVFPDGTLLKPIALGPAVWAAKTAEYNDRRYNLLGDPATRLATPKLGVALTLEQGGQVVSDTLARGMVTVLKGQVRDCLGDPVPGFTGQVAIEIRDSDVQRRPASVSIDYGLPGALIFSTELPVSGGAFTTEFFVPTALLSGDRGPARIYAYASQTEGDGFDACGSSHELVIGEAGGPLTDTTPPRIDLSWEDPAAPPQAGSRIAATLSDSSGLYVAALTPSRAVTVAILDEEDRFLAAADVSSQLRFASDFRTGVLTYALPAGLPNGQPLRLVLEASDNVMNRQRAELAFQLSAGAGGRLLETVYAMPNPVDRETHFLVELARSADVEITIYTATGRAVRRLGESGLSRERGRRIGLAWDGRDDDGDRLANGVYFYRVVAREPGGGRDERVERLVVFREAP